MPDGSSTPSPSLDGTRLARRLRREIEGEVWLDPFTRGRYATDASIYQVMPLGVTRPKSVADCEAILAIAREEGVSVLPRGGGTSQSGQTVNQALVMDVSRHMNAVLDIDPGRMRARVQPGVVLAELNARLARQGLLFPVDPSTASRATIGGMTANNSSGARSIRYGMMVDNVRGIDAILADGTRHHFGEVPADLSTGSGTPGYAELVRDMRALASREAEEMKERLPQVMRHVAGYNLHRVRPDVAHNMAQLLVGSEGTLGFFTGIDLDLKPLPRRKIVGICHFPRFRDAMETTRHLVTLEPDAVELVDRTIIELSRKIPIYAGTVARAVKGEPDALLIVEFSGDSDEALLRRLDELDEMMAALGFPGAVVRAVDPGFQQAVWRFREAGLNIVMSMKGDAKPISFIEDCAVPLDQLADFTENLTAVFRKHGTEGTWYAHASVGLLHVRPVVNLKNRAGADAMRAMAEEAFDFVRRYKGSHSGEHGDGIVRSEFHRVMLGERLTRTFEEIKDRFDPSGLLNPGRIVRPPRMDDRSLFRYAPGYAPLPLETGLDWSGSGGLLPAVEMCNNNGTCRKVAPDVMCPSYRATKDEQHVTRGRANTLRLALTGQLGPEALTAPEMQATLDLCVSCKGCKRECPTGIDMAKMKLEVLHQLRQRKRPSLRERLVAWMPRYADLAGRYSALANLRDAVPGAAWISEKTLGFSRHRPLPRWRRDSFRTPAATGRPAGDGRDIVLFADTFNTHHEPDNLRDALRVLEHAGYRVHMPMPADGRRPPCCGRTFLSAGLLEEARREMRRTLETWRPYLEAGVPVVGLEPSCLLTFRDELLSVLPGESSQRLAENALLFEEFLAREHRAARLALKLQPLAARRALVHGHCHQKAFDAMSAVGEMLSLIPGLEVETIASSCCGMAGAFGYAAEHYDVSMRMAELSLLPAVRRAAPDDIIVADGTSCRHQIRDGSVREARHVVSLLAEALPSAGRADSPEKVFANH